MISDINCECYAADMSGGWKKRFFFALQKSHVPTQSVAVLNTLILWEVIGFWELEVSLNVEVIQELRVLQLFIGLWYISVLWELETLKFQDFEN